MFFLELMLGIVNSFSSYPSSNSSIFLLDKLSLFYKLVWRLKVCIIENKSVKKFRLLLKEFPFKGILLTNSVTFSIIFVMVSTKR